MAALLGAVFAGLVQVFVRKMVQTEATAAIVFYFSTTAAVLSLATIPFGWAMPDAKGFALLIGAGVFGGIAQIILTESYRHAEAGLIAPFEYVSLLFALGFGYAIFAEVPTRTMLLGAALIVAAGLLIIWRERRLGIQRAAARKVMTPQG
jgi:drug/metabolite transporter (DMT)-like permease